MESLRLRGDVRLVSNAEGGPVLADTRTGRQYQFAPELQSMLEALFRPETAAFGEDESLALGELLGSLGLLERGLSAEDIERRQKESLRKEREALRWDRIRQTLEQAYEKVPFYRDRFVSAGLEPSDFTCLADLDQLPPTTKADIRQNFPTRMVAEGADLPSLLSSTRYSLAQTSGTTGDRLQVLFDHTAGHLPSVVRSMWGLSQTVPLNRGGIFTSPICAGFECHLEERAFAQRIRGTTLTFNTTDDFFSVPDAVVRSIADEMNGFGPHALFVNSWYACLFLFRARALGLKVPALTAVLPAYQYPTRVHRRLLSEGFSAPVYSNYGSTDLGGAQAGLECARGRLHMREDKVWVDITRSGKRVSNGELGKVSVTTLDNPYMPLIRYEVGDLGRRTDEECGCAVGESWQAFELHGRLADALLSTQQELLTTRLVDEAVGDEGPDFYSLRQEADNRYLLEYLSFSGQPPAASMERLQSLLGPSAQLVPRAVRRFSPEKSLKYRQTGMIPSLALPFSW